MRTGETLILIDGDSRRRAAVSHLLAGSDLHVEPFEDSSELASRWPSDGVILAHDDTGIVRDLIDAMSRSMKWMPLVAFAQQPGTAQVVRAVMDGASNYLAWPFTVEEVRRAAAAARESHQAMGSLRLREAAARSRIQRLTPREREVLAGVAAGLSNRLIGERLSISPRTVEIHRANMLNKIGASHSNEAIRIAIEAALVR
ncbi:LuxR family two component transcriptional regulator [Novosphingobium kunmingense]|uniref:LuxR family two component transcriptional regulator n=1 Tax=Novosphingobium kunmingense TaxID=1211806 RepID=A0A2N0H674_9SPHN|nr:LuxR C-terminal-related transcriptional regulator [Novosphingobium kunmingense]PKB14444.1 LuxR family two component transcriptional regulator [Novosphingobium kunmingense]